MQVPTHSWTMSITDIDDCRVRRVPPGYGAKEEADRPLICPDDTRFTNDGAKNYQG